MKNRIGFLLGGFPALSETFILNQIVGLSKYCEVHVYPTYKIEGKCHPTYLDLNQEKIHFPNNLKLFGRIKLFLKSIYLFKKNPTFFLNSINPFKYGLRALKLYKFQENYPFLIDSTENFIIHFADLGFRFFELKKDGLKIKSYLIFHGADFRLALKTNGLAYPFLSDVDYFLSISNLITEKLLEWGVDQEKIIRHNVGIQMPKHKLERIQTKTNKIQITSIGRLTEIKGHEFGIRVIFELVKKYGIKNILYNIIGEGEEYDNLLDQVKNLGFEQNVVFHGGQSGDYVYKLLSETDIYFHPSNDEMTPLAIMEAMSFNLPVVASNVGAVNEIVIEGSGFIYNVNDKNRCCDFLIKLIENKSLRENMGQIGANHIVNEYDIDNLNFRLWKIID